MIVIGIDWKILILVLYQYSPQPQNLLHLNVRVVLLYDRGTDDEITIEMVVEPHKSFSVVWEVVDGFQMSIRNIIVGSRKDFSLWGCPFITPVSSGSMRFFRGSMGWI